MKRRARVRVLLMTNLVIALGSLLVGCCAKPQAGEARLASERLSPVTTDPVRQENIRLYTGDYTDRSPAPWEP